MSGVGLYGGVNVLWYGLHGTNLSCPHIHDSWTVDNPIVEFSSVAGHRMNQIFRKKQITRQITCDCLLPINAAFMPLLIRNLLYRMGTIFLLLNIVWICLCSWSCVNWLIFSSDFKYLIHSVLWEMQAYECRATIALGNRILSDKFVGYPGIGTTLSPPHPLVGWTDIGLNKWLRVSNLCN